MNGLQTDGRRHLEHATLESVGATGNEGIVAGRDDGEEGGA